MPQTILPEQTITIVIPQSVLTPDSSQIHSLGYCSTRQIAFVRFKSSPERVCYAYPDFSQDLWDAWIAAESIGKFFYKHVKNQWEGRFVYLPGLEGSRV
jgi:hypothetical protein